MPRETEKRSQMMIGGKQIGGQRPGGRNQNGSGPTKSDDFFCLRIPHQRSGNFCVCDGRCTHTPCRTHIFLTHFPCAAYRHRAHAWLKVFCSAHVRSLHLTLSILMFHPPSLLFSHGHFDTSFPSAHSLPNCSRSESEGQAHFRTSGEEFGYLADPTHSTVFATVFCHLDYKRVAFAMLVSGFAMIRHGLHTRNNHLEEVRFKKQPARLNVSCTLLQF